MNNEINFSLNFTVDENGNISCKALDGDKIETIFNSNFLNVSKNKIAEYIDNKAKDNNIELVNAWSEELKVPVDGGNLIAYTSMSDYDTKQVGLAYELDGIAVDLALAEVKKGGLAVAYGLDDSNANVDLYVYGNPLEEDYTNSYTLKYEDIKKAID